MQKHCRPPTVPLSPSPPPLHAYVSSDTEPTLCGWRSTVSVPSTAPRFRLAHGSWLMALICRNPTPMPVRQYPDSAVLVCS